MKIVFQYIVYFFKINNNNNDTIRNWMEKDYDDIGVEIDYNNSNDNGNNTNNDHHSKQ